MNRRVVYVVLGFTLTAFWAGRVGADPVENIINQASIAEYQSYLRVLTGVAEVPGHAGYYQSNRYSLGPDISVAGEYIYNSFASSGLNHTYQVFNSSYGPNVIAELPGTTRPQDIYVICAHYDTYHAGDQLHAPGCDDNGSGTAAVMMAARILSHYQFEGTIRFIAFSGEEQWMVGSNAYVANAYNAGENIAAAINCDMILHPRWDSPTSDPNEYLHIEKNDSSSGLADY
jgi:hypothetical protein